MSPRGAQPSQYCLGALLSKLLEALLGGAGKGDSKTYDAQLQVTWSAIDALQSALRRRSWTTSASWC